MFRFTLRYKLLLYSVVLALVPLGLASTRMIRITQDELKSSANDEIRVTAEELAKDVDAIYSESWVAPLELVASALDSEDLGLNEKIALLSSGIPEIVSVASCQLSLEGVPNPMRVTREEIASRLREAGLEPDAVLGISGERLAGLSADGAATGELEYVAEADLWLLSVLLPLDNPIAGRRATLAARLDLERLRRYIDEHPFQKTGSITLVDAAGRKIFDPERTDLSSYEIVADATERLASDSRVVSVGPYPRPTGQKMLGGYAFPRHLDLAIVVERDEGDAYLAVSKMRQSLLGWVLAGLAIAVVFAFLGALGISRPVEDIAAVAREVGGGNFDVRARERRSSDEIAALGRQINSMIEGLVERERVKGENVVLRDLNERLNALNDQKNKLLGMAAHDLRNPINAILGYSQMVLEDLEDEDDVDVELKMVIQKIESSSKFMAHLLADLLDLATIESGKIELHPENTDLAVLLRQNLEINRFIASKKDIRVELECDDDLPTLWFDPPKVEQVLNNLVSNAVKFSYPGSVVRVRVEKRPDEVSIAVIDEGQGIPPDEVDKVFRPFQKLSVKSTAGESSTGLGLAIVKKIVDAHGGHLGLESEVGKGSTFYLSLPVGDSPEGRAGERRFERVETRFSIRFSVLSRAGTSSRAGLGTALDLSRGGALMESTVPLATGDEIHFFLQLPEVSIVGTGDIVRQVSPSRVGLRFAGLEGDSEAQLQEFLEGRGDAGTSEG